MRSWLRHDALWHGGVFAVLVLFFWIGWLNVASPVWRMAGDAYSDRLVFDVVLSGQMPAQGPWLGGFGGDRHPVLMADQKAYAERILAGVAVEPYYSQIGLQAWLMQPAALVNRAFGGMVGLVGSLHAMRLQVALMNAAVFGLLAVWLAGVFGRRTVAVGGLLVLVTQPWLGYYGTSVYWQMWAWVLPMALVGLVVHLMGPRPGWRMGTGAAVAAVVACGLKATMGYEFMAPILIAMMLPLVHAAVKDVAGAKPVARRGRVPAWLVLMTGVGVAGLAGVVAAAVWHVYLLADVAGGSWGAGLEIFMQIVANRVAWVDGQATNAIFVESLNVPLWKLLATYVLMPMRALPEVLWLGLFGWVAWKLWRNEAGEGLGRAERVALVVLVGVAVLAPLSWLVLAKGHASIHKHLCPVLWAWPLNLLGCLMVVKAYEVRLLRWFKRLVAGV